MTNPCGLLHLVFAAIQQRGRGPALLALKKPMRPSSAARSWPLAARAKEARAAAGALAAIQQRC